MKLLVHADAGTDVDAAQLAWLSAQLEHLLGRFRDHLGRVDARLSQLTGSPAGTDESRCRLEAWIEGRDPVAVSHQAAQPQQAVRGAADKLARLLDSTLERLHGYPRGAGLAPLPPPAE